MLYYMSPSGNVVFNGPKKVRRQGFRVQRPTLFKNEDKRLARRPVGGVMTRLGNLGPSWFREKLNVSEYATA